MPYRSAVSYTLLTRYAPDTPVPFGGKVCGRQNTEGLCSCFHINEVIVQAKHTVFGLYADRFCEVLCRYSYGIAVYRYRKLRICKMVMLRCTEQRRSGRYDVSIDNQLIRQMNFQRILTVEIKMRHPLSAVGRCVDLEGSLFDYGRIRTAQRTILRFQQSAHPFHSQREDLH